MRKLKKCCAKLFSMKTALVIFLLLLAACLFGSLIPQGESDNYYFTSYSQSAANILVFFQLNDVFHTWWFAVLSAFLCINLLGCNLIRFPVLFKKMKNGFCPDKRCKELSAEDFAEFSGDISRLFRLMGFKTVCDAKTVNGENAMYAVRNKIGIWGAWLTHLGILIIILGFSFGQIYTEKESVYGVEGQTKNIPDTDFELTIDRFETNLREDETVEQYTSFVTVRNKITGETQSGEVSVNHPLSLFGRKLYQNSTGWAANVRICKGDEVEKEEVLCAGEMIASVSVPKLQLLFSAFYPDYVEKKGEMPETASAQLNNPAYLYMLFYDEQLLGMNILKSGETVSVDELSFVFDHPQQYTLIQMKRDPFTFLVLIGGIIICFALVCAFYFRTEELLAIKKTDMRETWYIIGKSRKGGILYQEKLNDSIMKLQGGKKLEQ